MLLKQHLEKRHLEKYTLYEREKSQRQKKKVQKDRNLPERISLMEIKMRGHYLGTGSLKFQLNFQEHINYH